MPSQRGLSVPKVGGALVASGGIWRRRVAWNAARGHKARTYLRTPWRVVYRLAFIISLDVSPGLATEPALTIRKSPFSSSTYRLWKEPRRDPTPRSVERVIKRSAPIGAQTQKLEEQGGRFSSERKAPYVKPPQH